MFATCIFCHASLGANESIEHFPVGKRIAFDGAKGRLWVVCPKCERWNLSPLEERWEAIEEGERLYRDTTKRVATGHIGLAQLKDGMQLIRIGEPLRPEFAAWRYGDQFGRRRRRFVLLGTGSVVVVGAVVLGAPMFGVALGTGVSAMQMLNVGNVLFQKYSPRVHVTDGVGRTLSLTRHDLYQTKVSLGGSDNGMLVQFPYREWSPTGRLLRSVSIAKRPNAKRNEFAHLDADDALRALTSILPAINGAGGSASDIERAVNAVESHGNSVPALLRTAMDAVPGWVGPKGQTASNLPKALRLALEMSLHEEDERRALEGELHELEQRWKDAEQIAAIADALTLPESVDARIGSLRKDKSD